jgi:hypothetical protein
VTVATKGIIMRTTEVSPIVRNKLREIQDRVLKDYSIKLSFKINWKGRRGLHLVSDKIFISVYSSKDKRDQGVIKRAYKDNLNYYEFNLKKDTIEDLISQIKGI